MAAFLSEMRSRHHALFITALIVTIANFGLWSNRISTKLVYADSAKVVSLFADGQKRVITTDAPTVGDLLKRAGVVLGKDDLVEPAASAGIPSGFFNINVYRAHPVLLVDGAQQYPMWTAYGSPKLVAQQAGLTVYPEDEFKITTVTDFVGDGVVGEHIDIIRAVPVTIHVDGKTAQYRTQAKTIGDLLAERQIPLGEKDTVSPASSAPVSAGQRITITRVADVTETKTEVIARPVQQVTDPNLPKGTSQVKDDGADGQRTVTYHIRYNDGVVVQTEILSVTGETKPKPRIVIIGTKVFFSGSVEYWRPYVTDAATANGVNPNLMLAIMTCESRGNANAYNPAGAFGLFQYQPDTWGRMGGTMNNIYDGPTQIQKTAWKLAQPNGISAWNASKWCWGNAY